MTDASVAGRDSSGAPSASELQRSILVLLPGAVTAVRDGLEPARIDFRIGPALTATVERRPEGWAMSDAPAGRPLLATPPQPSAPALAQAFAAALRERVAGLRPGEADPGLVAALSGFAPPAVPTHITPPFAPGQASGFGGWTVPPVPSAVAAVQPVPVSFTRRAVVIASIVVGSLLVLGGGGAGIAALVGAASPPRSSSSGSSAQGTDDGATGTSPATGLRVGQCFDAAGAVETSDKVKPLSCTARHDSEVFARVTVPTSTDSSGRETYDRADLACLSRFAGYVGDEYNDSDLDFDVLTPSQQAYVAGDRTALCYVTSDDEISSSVRGSGE